MIPKSLSASSLLVSEACMVRWKTENYDKVPQISSEPADIGTSCHFALENFVRDVYIEEKYGWDQIHHLKAYYDIGYIDTFGSADFDTPAYKDGAELVAKWYDRNKNGLPNKVISCEIKESFPIKTSAGEIPFNFIYDRFDQLEEDVYEVVDYKSLRGYVRPEDLKQKIQPRAYALAAQIKFPNAQRIWVSFDMLRFDGKVGVVFTRDENAATWRYLKRAAERIIAADENNLEEKLNLECKWCARKTICDTLLRANAGGNPMSMSIEQLAQRKMEISSQLQALKYADNEIDALLCKESERTGDFEFDAGPNVVNITARQSRRVQNSNAVINIIGPELATKYGNMTVTNIDKMIASGVLTDEQIKQVRAQIGVTWSEPSAKVKPKGDFS